MQITGRRTESELIVVWQGGIVYGDSDSTGAVTGGAVLGIKNIPQKFIEGLELKETLLDIADKLQLHQLDTE